MNRRHWLQLALASGTTAACRKETAVSAPVAEVPWQPLHDGWQHVMGGPLTRPAPETLRLGWGESLSAVRWTGPLPEHPFEIELEARRMDGTDFFCGLTFPARPSGECLTWIVGGWGGSLVGLSSIDGRDAAENETTLHRRFEKEHWYRLRLECREDRIRAWIDGEKVIELATTGRALGLRPGPVDQCAPLGLGTWQTTGEFRRIHWRNAGKVK